MSAVKHAGSLSADHLQRPANLFAVLAARLSVVQELLEEASNMAPPAGSMAGRLAERLALVSGELQTLAVMADLGDNERSRFAELLRPFDDGTGARAPAKGN